MKGFNRIALGLAAAAAQVAEAFEGREGKIISTDEVHSDDSKRKKAIERNECDKVYFGYERRKGKGERKRTRGDWSNSRGRR